MSEAIKVDAGYAQAIQALDRLVAARLRVAPVSERTRNRLEGRSGDEIMLELKLGPGRQRVVLGLLVAERALEDARVSQLVEHLDGAVFRLGHHYRVLAYEPAPDAQRAAAASASRRLFETNLRPNANDNLVSVRRLEENLRRCSPEITWEKVVGLSEEEFGACLGAIKQGLTPPRRREPVPASVSAVADDTPSSPAPVVTHDTRPSPAPVKPPAWIFLGSPERIDPVFVSQGPWPARNAADFAPRGLDDETLLAQCYQAFAVRDYAQAGAFADALATTLGVSWGPSQRFEEKQTWRFLRAVRHLALMDVGAPSSRRLHALSAYELIAMIDGCDELADELVAAATEGFDPSGAPEAGEYGAIFARLLSLGDHERVVEGFSGRDRSYLREAVKQACGSHDLPAHDTKSLALELHSLRTGLMGELQAGYAAQDLETCMRRAGQLQDLLLPDEQKIAKATLEVVGRALNAARRDERTRTIELLDLADRVADIATDARRDGSALFHDAYLPAIALVEGRVQSAREQALRVSRPEVRAYLVTDHLPLTGDSSQDISVGIRLANKGNTTARNVSVVLSAPSVRAPRDPEVVPELSPGAERGVTILINADERLATVEFAVRLTWADEYGQGFTEETTLVAEGEKPSNWRPDDLNPYTLEVVRDGHRLVGRGRDLAELTARLKAGTSVFVTGQKRVGKSSLVRVALDMVEANGLLTGLVPYGYIQAETTEGLISNILANLCFALQDGVTGDLPAPPVVTEGMSLAPAGMWLQKVGKILTRAKARAVFTIDDFDDLPRPFFESDAGAPLFTFMRALVSESWLTVILVGSEIMPKLMTSHSYKLNQVSRLDIDRFDAAESTGELLRRPVEDRLEWSDDAVELVHFLTGGNPYYGTLLGQRIWDQLRARERTFVTESDIREAADNEAERAQPVHFVHLWADGPAGIDPSSDFSIENSALLYATACCAGAESIAERDEVMSVAAVRLGPDAQKRLDLRLETLLQRHVLIASGDRGLRFSIPLAQSWFKRSALNHLGAQLRAFSDAARESTYISDRELIDLSEGFTFGERHISEIRIRDWLNQFEDSRLRRAAFRMLERLRSEGYFNLGRIDQVATDLRSLLRTSPLGRHIEIKANGQHSANVCLAYLHEYDRSTAERVARALLVPGSDTVPFTDVEAWVEKSAARKKVILVFESFDGDGSHARSAIEATIERFGAVEDGTILTSAVTLASTEPSDVVATAGARVPRFVGAVVGPRLRPFGAEDSCIGDADTVSLTREVFQPLGQALDRRHPFGWSPDGILVLFEDHGPTYLPPIFWKDGRFAGKPWRPLFSGMPDWEGERKAPRSLEQEAILDMIRTHENDGVEFKSSLRVNIPDGQLDKGREADVFKAVAGFLNGNGGDLLIGIADDGKILGLERDMASLGPKMAGKDGFERHLRSRLDSNVEGLVPGDLDITFVSFDEGDVCRVTCRTAGRPVFVKVGDNQKFYLRSGNRTVEPTQSQFFEYSRKRWPS